jgi:hypothetical protein
MHTLGVQGCVGLGDLVAAAKVDDARARQEDARKAKYQILQDKIRVRMENYVDPGVLMITVDVTSDADLSEFLTTLSRICCERAVGKRTLIRLRRRY